jgi:hypothetical protein
MSEYVSTKVASFDVAVALASLDHVGNQSRCWEDTLLRSPMGLGPDTTDLYTEKDQDVAMRSVKMQVLGVVS